MQIKKIGLKNFRNHQSLSFDFSDHLNVLTGDNAVGKTNIVEAIYYLSLARSFRTSEDDDLIKKNQDRAEIDAVIVEGEITTFGSFSGLERLIVISSVPYFPSYSHLTSLAILSRRI